MTKEKIVKRTRPPHYQLIKNELTFDDAYSLIMQSPYRLYATTGNCTEFIARSTIVAKGKHSGGKVIIFMSGSKEKARAYKCCWGYRTNCNRTYIDCYTRAIQR